MRTFGVMRLSESSGSKNQRSGGYRLRFFVVLLAVLVLVLFVLSFPPARSLVSDFFYTFFISPLGRSFNPVNSTVYAVVLFVALYFVSRALTFLGVEVDGRFVLSVLPFIFIGSSTRVLRDAEILSSIIFVTPIIYFVIFLYTFGSLLLSLLISRKTGTSFYWTFLMFGLVPAAYLAYPIVQNVVDIESTSLILFYTAIAAAVAFLAMLVIHRFVKFEKFALDYSVVSAHLFDASATFISVTYYGYYEQHFLVRMITSSFGTLAFFPLDFLALVVVLIVMERTLKGEKQLIGLFRLALLILGLAPGMRDLFRIAMLA